jgi:hypothetical protein
MKIAQSVWTRDSKWTRHGGMLEDGARADLALVFGAAEAIREPDIMRDVQRLHPGAYICGCSTSGEVHGRNVLDESVVVTALRFEHTTIRGAHVSVSGPEHSFEAGQKLATAIPHEGLVHAFVLSDGLFVNGSELVNGISSKLPPGVVVTGGLSGDGARFAETLVCAAGEVKPKQIAIIGFYGNRLRVGIGSMGGWDPFGPERRITRSQGNVLFELDGRSALDLYKEYLGKHADGLPASGLLFPLTLRQPDATETVVRTILAVDEADKSMTFAGDMPEGSWARLMRANFDRLVDGAAGAARKSQQILRDGNPELAILISCVGRKLVLKQRVEEEVEGVLDVLGPKTLSAGFYSYGEISPFTPEAKCAALHNQTMTITTFAEC